MAAPHKNSQLQIRVTKSEKPPGWTRNITPLREPVFATSLQILRLYLLTHSPAPFRHRNIFIDSSIGERV